MRDVAALGMAAQGLQADRGGVGRYVFVSHFRFSIAPNKPWGHPIGPGCWHPANVHPTIVQRSALSGSVVIP